MMIFNMLLSGGYGH